MSPARRASHWGIAVATAVALGIVLVLGRGEARLPEDLPDDMVVANLGAGSAALPPELSRAAARLREAPADQDAALQAARLYLGHSHATGDARFAGAALGALQLLLNGRPSAEILNLAASARQYVHDFDGALDLLDRVISADPRNAQALLSRANIHIVKGEFAEASANCTGLARAGRTDLAILCDTTAKALTSEAPLAYQRLDTLVSANAMDPALVGYAQSLLAEIARFQEWPDKARQKFEAARSADPGDLRTLMVFADLELSQGRPVEALRLMVGAPASDGILVRRAIASKAVGDEAELMRLKQILRGRFSTAALIGETAHARESARYWLEVEEDAEQALASARINWAEQRELEDAMLLAAAAVAAGQSDAAVAVIDWADRQGVTAPMYLSALVEHGLAAKGAE